MIVLVMMAMVVCVMHSIPIVPILVISTPHLFILIRLIHLNLASCTAQLLSGSTTQFPRGSERGILRLTCGVV